MMFLDASQAVCTTCGPQDMKAGRPMTPHMRHRVVKRLRRRRNVRKLGESPYPW